MFNFLKKIDPDLFISLNAKQQLVFILLVSSGVIIVFSVFMNSFGLGINLFLDPGNYADAFDEYPIIGMIEVIVGVIFSGALISTITSGFFNWAENSRISKLHSIILEAFETIPSIKTRKILDELKLKSKLRNFNIDEAEVRLEIPKSDIVQAIQTFGNLRLRFLKDTKETVIEQFTANKNYGCFENRNSPITILSTQNYSDAGIGHFAATLADNLAANYISNEFFSSGAPLKKKQINFSTNDAYIDLEKSCETEVLTTFISDSKHVIKNSQFTIYFGTSNGDRVHDVHILFGGLLGQNNFEIQEPTYTNLRHLEEVFLQFKSEMATKSIKVATHEEFGNVKSQHLSQALRKQLKTEILTIYISTRILWSKDDALYFSLIESLVKMVSKLK